MKQIEFTNLGKQCKLFVHPFSEAVSETIEKNRNFLEYQTLNTLVPDFSEGHKTILDVGANIGNHTVFFDEFFECEKILAFEPHSVNFEVLKLNVEGRSKIQVFNKGCSNYHGTAHIHIPGNNYGGGQFLTENNVSSCLGGKPIINNGDCEIITIDSLNLNDVTFIKLDIEGHEKMALEGATETIARCRPILLVEDYHNVYDGWLFEKFQYKCVKTWENDINKLYSYSP